MISSNETVICRRGSIEWQNIWQKWSDHQCIAMAIHCFHQSSWLGQNIGEIGKSSEESAEAFCPKVNSSIYHIFLQHHRHTQYQYPSFNSNTNLSHICGTSSPTSIVVQELAFPSLRFDNTFYLTVDLGPICQVKIRKK